MDPVTLLLGGGAALMLLLSGKKQEAPVPPLPPLPDPCSPEQVQQYVLAAINGGVQGGAATGNPYAAGGAAVLGAIGRPGALKCGQDKFNEAKAKLCANAEKVKKAVEARFGDSVIPDSKWKKMSCDEKIAYAAALGPMGIQAVLAGALVGAAWNTTRNQVEDWADDAQKQAKKVGDALTDPAGTVASWGQKAGNAFGL